MAPLDPADVQRRLLMLAQQSREHAVILLDPQGRIAWWGDGARHIFGYPESRMLGEPASRLFVPEDNDKGMAEHELAVARADDAAEDDRWQLRADGSRFWASGVLIALRDADGTLLGFGKILRNRTDIREQLETLRNKAVEAQAAAHSKDVFLATLSHELRNPLAPLANAISIIRFAAPATREVEYALKVIERQMAVMQRLVDDLLDHARAEAGKIELKREKLALREILAHAVEATRTIVRQHRHQLDLVLPAGEIMVAGDPDRLHQVFVNLVNNAAKYTPQGGRIWVKATIEGDEAVVRVEDTGVGIPVAMLPRIFDLFTQVESSRGQSHGGLGIGLSLVKSLVALHGGTVQVRSDGPGKGSEFTVRLPMAGD